MFSKFISASILFLLLVTLSACNKVESFNACAEASSPEYIKFSEIDAPSAIEKCEYAISKDRKNAELWSHLARAYLKAEQYPDALEWMEIAANEGTVSAQTNLGWMYQNGKGVTQSDTEAVKLYRLAADQGYVKAQDNLGWMYEKGRGVTQSYTKAIQWYRLAADQGSARSQFALGVMYANGTGVTQSDTQAAKWYQLAADQGFANAQYYLGLKYADGKGVEQNSATAIIWLQKAADQGFSDAEEKVAKYIEAERRARGICEAPAIGTRVWGIFSDDGESPDDTLVREGFIGQIGDKNVRVDWTGCPTCTPWSNTCTLYKTKQEAKTRARQLDAEHLSVGEAVDGVVAAGIIALMYCLANPDKC